MKKYFWIILIGIVMLAAALRLWQLGSVPPSPDWDEAALGYNAYSIIHTGKDEFGKSFPVVIRSFNDYKPALYSYLAIPSILLFGLNVFAVRLPSAIFGIISVLAVYFLVKELFSEKLRTKSQELIALFSAGLMAISPWSLQFSRVGFESNVGNTLNILMVLSFVIGLKKPWFLIFSSFLAGLSIYAYQSEKVFTPLLLFLLIFIYRNKLFSLSKKYLSLAVILGLIVILPMILYIFTNQQALLRVTGTSILSSQNEILKFNIIKLETDIKNNDKLGYVLDNRRLVYINELISGYISHFDINWLFFKGDIARHHAPNMGLLYIFEMPLVLMGIYKLLFGNFDKKTKLVIFGWFLLAPIPASITTGVPHAVRTLNFLPTFQIFTAIGLITLVPLLSDIKYPVLSIKYSKFLVIIITFSLLVFNFIYYLNQYFVQQNYFNSQDWKYGYKQVVEEVLKQQDKYKRIVIADDKTMDQSYIFFLFYLKYSPKDYQKFREHSSKDSVNHNFDRYTFRTIDWQKDAVSKNSLFVVGPGDTPKTVSTIKTIYNLDGTVAIKIVGT